MGEYVTVYLGTKASAGRRVGLVTFLVAGLARLGDTWQLAQDGGLGSRATGTG